MEYSSSSSWSNLTATTYSRRIAVMAVLVVAGYLTTISRNVAVALPAARHYCSGAAPEDPVKYYAHAEKVMNTLVRRAPSDWARMYKAWHQTQKVGSIAGAAICYTHNVGLCRACLKGLKASLEGCKKYTTGGSFSPHCNMQFWTIAD